MMIKPKYLLFLYVALSLNIILLFISCKKNPTEPSTDLYFPPTNGTEWATIAPESLGWDIAELNDLYNYLSENKTRAFIILKNGRIVIEKYWGNNIFETAPFTQTSQWYWASAGKSLTAFLTGIAQQDGLLTIDDKTSDYLGTGWTSLSLEKEGLITIKHQLTMTTGLDYTISDLDCTDPACLQYKADAGTQWYYHNAPYTLLEKVIENASGKIYNQFTDEKIETRIGMNGTWILSGYNNVYWSTARDAARFGLLILNKGKWDSDLVLSDAGYYNAMLTSSQNLNLSYGYLWWLNGKNSTIFPGSPSAFPISTTPDGPSDLISAMGKNGQFVDVVPSLNLVVVRMGEAPDGSLVPVVFHNDLWLKLMEIIE
jgi:CubicO group peptidase (beta-lactamase class C family)